LESAAPHTVLALAAAGHGIGIVPSNVQIPTKGVSAIPLMRDQIPIGQWVVVAWNPERFLAEYAKQFVEELVAYCRRNYPNRQFIKRAPSLHRPTMSR
jgi:DNA-binding transcriptional LysR family regulator